MVTEIETALAELLRAVGKGEKHTAPGTLTGTQYAHGPNGLLSFPGVDPDVYTAMLGNIGMVNMLLTKASVFANPVFTTITGVQDDEAVAEPSTACAAPPSAGLKKACTVRAPFGRYARQTREIDITRIGMFNDMADPNYLRLVNNPIQPGGLFNTGAGDTTTPGDLLTNEITQKFWELAVGLNRLLGPQLFRGNPANNLGTGYAEITGFDTLINTGYEDLTSGTTCPSMDSDIKNFACANVATNADALIRALSYMYRYVKDKAFRQNMLPVQWVLAMRPELFFEISAVWPCAYMSYMCNTSGSTTTVSQINGADMVALRDDIRTNSYLIINGDKIPVVQDDGIAEIDGGNATTPPAPGCFCSDIYLIPLSVMGGRAVTYLEYMDWNAPGAARDALAKQGLFTIQGPWIVIPSQLRNCMLWEAIIEPRLVMRTPWLAGRLQNVAYCPLQHTGQPFPSDAYWQDGGVTYLTSLPTSHDVWERAQ